MRVITEEVLHQEKLIKDPRKLSFGLSIIDNSYYSLVCNDCLVFNYIRKSHLYLVSVVYYEINLASCL